VTLYIVISLLLITAVKKRFESIMNIGTVRDKKLQKILLEIVYTLTWSMPFLFVFFFIYFKIVTVTQLLSNCKRSANII
jgi:hypothetical protein